MCGRYAIVPHPRAWAPVEDVLGPGILDALRDLEARYNVAPTQQVPVIWQERGSRKVVVELARWGFVPYWAKDLKIGASTINARSEDAPTKPMWREAWRAARCLIPATHWYEWQKIGGGKQPYALSVGDGGGFMFAGLLSWWRQTPDTEPVLTCAILTRDAAPSVAHVHDRMPVVLNPRVWEEWIDREVTDLRQIDQMLGLNAELGVESYPVSPRVSSPRNDGPDLLQRFDPPPDLLGP